jgi:hypothetical protein
MFPVIVNTLQIYIGDRLLDCLGETTLTLSAKAPFKR